MSAGLTDDDEEFSQMSVLPPEILIVIIDTLSFNSQFGTYTHTPEVKNALQSLALVNHVFYQWSLSHLYSCVTVTNNQIGQLVATLQGTTHHAQSLAKQIHSLRLVMNNVAKWLGDHNDHLINAISLLHILDPTLAIQQLFMDMDILMIQSRTSHNLHNAIRCLTSLSELTLLNQEHQDTHFFWDMELEHKYSCLLGLEVLTVGDVTIDELGTTEFLISLPNLKELVLIHPWANPNNTEVRSILASLFTPHQALQHLTFVLVEGWMALGLETLMVADLSPAMVPYLDKVNIFSEREPGVTRSWVEIGDMIGMGHQWIW
ncbi:hypothetical protein FRB94_002753 [Tulasnella sp. JGI-2019a]|nr:hypothetical protein FRB94_002753 [Tulasnella sp. JGI-2019a]